VRENALLGWPRSRIARENILAYRGLVPDPKLAGYMAATVNSFHVARTDIEQALALIQHRLRAREQVQPVQLLALRRYVRLGDRKLRSKWAWTSEETERLSQSGPARLLLSEASRVQQVFALQNPGYALDISPLRSLDRQVLLWTKNNSVQASADRLLGMAASELQKREYRDVPDGTSTKAFVEYLRRVEVKPEPTSAAPGISDHGQMRAVDFVVRRGGVIVAGTETLRIPGDWQRTGFESKLQRAASETKLLGPLKYPHEPWHYRLGP
jgi:hypothetical protein